MYLLLLLVACSNLNLEMNYKPYDSEQIKRLCSTLTLENKQALEKWSKENINQKYGGKNKAIFLIMQYKESSIEGTQGFFGGLLNNIFRSLLNDFEKAQDMQKKEILHEWVDTSEVFPSLISYGFKEQAKDFIKMFGKLADPEIKKKIRSLYSKGASDFALFELGMQGTATIAPLSISGITQDEKDVKKAIIVRAIIEDEYRIIDFVPHAQFESFDFLKLCCENGKGLCMQRLCYRLKNYPTDSLNLKKFFWPNIKEFNIKNEYVLTLLLKLHEVMLNPSDVILNIDPSKAKKKKEISNITLKLFDKSKLLFYPKETTNKFRTYIDHQRLPFVVSAIDFICYYISNYCKFYCKEGDNSQFEIPILTEIYKIPLLCFTMIYAFLFWVVPKHNFKSYLKELKSKRDLLFAEFPKMSQEFCNRNLEFQLISNQIAPKEVVDLPLDKQNLMKCWNEVLSEVNSIESLQYDSLGLIDKYNVKIAFLDLESLEKHLLVLLKEKLRFLIELQPVSIV